MIVATIVIRDAADAPGASAQLSILSDPSVAHL